jgi:hypothetical protein
MAVDSTAPTNQKPARNAATAHRPRKAEARSRVTNGADILPGIDGRSTIARRYRDLCAALASDQGGADRMSECRQQLCRRFAAAACMAENLEARLANGETIDVAEFSMLSSTLVRLASRIGLARIAREIVPTLAQYLEQKHAEPA